MLWRHLCLARALAASALLTGSMIGGTFAGEPAEPTPGADAGSETVKVLDAEKAGILGVDVRGHGQDRVRVALRNTSGKRLNVVLPPGLVASNSVGQPGGAGGGAGGGGGFQSMGLGAPSNKPGGFGQFNGARPEAGFRSIAPAADASANVVTVPAGQKVDVDIPAVCLNFGLPTPTPKDKFRLVDVDDYSKDARVRRALRSLATFGTSQGTAQAAMWRICNNIPFETMLAKGDKVVNPAEVALASRFVEAIDAQGSELVELAYLAEARIFVSIEGEGMLGKDARRLASSLDGLRILGLPVRVTAVGEAPKASSPALHLGVTLLSGPSGETRGHIVVQAASGIGEPSWNTLGMATFKDASNASALDAGSLARDLDHAVASAFVSTKVARRSQGSTTLRVENRLPFTLAHLTIKAGTSSGAPMVDLGAVGVGPGRTGMVTIPAANGSIDRVELNGL